MNAEQDARYTSFYKKLDICPIDGIGDCDLKQIFMAQEEYWQKKYEELEVQFKSNNFCLAEQVTSLIFEKRKLEARISALEQFVKTCKYSLHNGEPVYQFSVEKLEALDASSPKER